MQRTVDADAKTAESPTETTLVCGSSCSFAAAVVLAADVTAADADAATISAETTPVCGSSCSFAAAVDADSDSPLSKNSPVHILHRGVFSFPYLRQIHSPLIFQRTFLSLLTLHALFFQYFLFPDLTFQHTIFINLIHCISVDDQFSLHGPYTPVFLFSTIICRDSVLSLSSYFISTPHIYRMWDMIAKIGSVFMEKKPTKPMTPFDEVTIPFELTLLKLILPYTSAAKEQTVWILSLIHISEPTRRGQVSRMPSSA